MNRYLDRNRIAGRPARAGSSSGTHSPVSADWRWQRFRTRNSSAPEPVAALAEKPAHFPAKARSVIFLFMAGGPSHMDTFDPKPLLNKLAGQKRPKEFGDVKYQQIQSNAKLLGTHRTFQKYGESGIEVSDLFPRIASCIDDIAVIRSCHGDMVVHSAAQYELFTGRVVPGFPSIGSWLLYGLGSESDSLPAYVVMPDPKGALEAGQPMYAARLLAGRISTDHVPARPAARDESRAAPGDHQRAPAEDIAAHPRIE